jgi:hypothetical protein
MNTSRNNSEFIGMSPEEAAARARARRDQDEMDVPSTPPVEDPPKLKEEKKPPLERIEPNKTGVVGATGSRAQAEHGDFIGHGQNRSGFDRQGREPILVASVATPAPKQSTPVAPTPPPPSRPAIPEPSPVDRAKAVVAGEYVSRGELPAIISAAINSFLQAISAETGSDSPEVLKKVEGSLLWGFGLVKDTTAYPKYMVYQITDDTTTPPTARWDWVRAHG